MRLRLAIALLLLATFSPAQKTLSPHDISKARQRETVSAKSLSVPEKAREELFKAVTAYSRHDAQASQHHLEASLRIAPDFAEAFSFRGFVEINANRFDAAMDDLQHSLHADPALPITYLYMGSLLNHLGRYDEALASLDHNAQFDPRSWSCAYERARSWLGKHEYEHALVEINRAVALGAEARMGNALRILRGNALYGLKQYDQATAELQAYLSAEPDGKLASVARDLMSHIDRDAIVAEK